jgi:hypothetical protein
MLVFFSLGIIVHPQSMGCFELRIVVNLGKLEKSSPMVKSSYLHLTQVGIGSNARVLWKPLSNSQPYSIPKPKTCI